MPRSIYVLFTVYVLSTCMPLFADDVVSVKPAKGEMDICEGLVSGDPGVGFIPPQSKVPERRVRNNRSRVKSIDTTKRHPILLEIEEYLRDEVKAQPVMIDALMNVLDRAIAQKPGGRDDEVIVLKPERGPLGSALIDGPTGVGKTLLGEALARITGGELVELEGGNYMTKQQVQGLTGAPPTYVGFGKTQPKITQAVLEKARGKKIPITIVLINEIDKTHEDFQDWWLKGLDSGTNTVWVPEPVKDSRDNNHNAREEVIDFGFTIVIGTSNAGSFEVQAQAQNIVNAVSRDNADQVKQAFGVGDLIRKAPPGENFYHRIRLKIQDTLKRPEFLGRWDEVTVAWPLLEKGYKKVIEREVQKVRKQIEGMGSVSKMPLRLTYSATDFIFRQTDFRLGGRNVAKMVKRFVYSPVIRALGSGQITSGDRVIGDVTEDRTELEFFTSNFKLENKGKTEEDHPADEDPDEGMDEDGFIVVEDVEDDAPKGDDKDSEVEVEEPPKKEIVRQRPKTGESVPINNEHLKFLDDEVWLQANILRQAENFLENHSSIGVDDAQAILAHLPRGLSWGWREPNNRTYTQETLINYKLTNWASADFEYMDLDVVFRTLVSVKKLTLGREKKLSLRRSARDIITKSKGFEDKKDQYQDELLALVDKILKIKISGDE